jgi:hypothetical protein
MKPDDNDTDQEISENEREDLGESSSSSNIQDDNLDTLQGVLHLDQARRNKTI